MFLTYNSYVIRGGIALLVAAFVVTGCGSASKHPTTARAVTRPRYALQQIKAAFATEGITLQKMVGTRRLVVLKDSQWDGPFGYQRVGHKQSSVTQFLVFVGNGPHSAQRGNVWVGYSDGEGATVKAALGQLASTTSNHPQTLTHVRACLERHGWPVERVSHNEIASQHGAVVWDITFRHSRPPAVGWTGYGGQKGAPKVLNRCVWGRG